MIDPESAKIALTAPFPEIVIAGNVANQVPSTQAFLDEVHEVRNPLTQLFHDHYGTEFPFWDETAAAVMVDRGVVLNSTTGMDFSSYLYSFLFFFFFFIFSYFLAILLINDSVYRCGRRVWKPQLWQYSCLSKGVDASRVEERDVCASG